MLVFITISILVAIWDTRYGKYITLVIAAIFFSFIAWLFLGDKTKKKKKAPSDNQTYTSSLEADTVISGPTNVGRAHDNFEAKKQNVAGTSGRVTVPAIHKEAANKEEESEKPQNGLRSHVPRRESSSAPNQDVTDHAIPYRLDKRRLTQRTSRNQIPQVFKNNDLSNADGINFLREYHPYWIVFKTDRNPHFDDFDGKILDLKEDKNNAVEYFYRKLNPIINNGISVAVVPSHDPRKKVSGVRRLAELLGREGGRTDASGCLVRTKKIDKLATGGQRSIQIHKNSISLVNAKLINGRVVLLIDDVTTTGNSLHACKETLLANGALKVECLALGKTTH